MQEIILYDYWRSSASYRVRIALNLKGLEYRSVSVNLLTREQRSSEHMQRNRQGYVPALQIDGRMMTQSIAILEYLDQTRPKPALLPADAINCQRVRALAHVIAMDIHPICNLNVVGYFIGELNEGPDRKAAWMQHFIAKGLTAFEAMLRDDECGEFCFGNAPGLADICLVPQLYNAERWQVDLSSYPLTTAIGDRCAGINAFQNAHPDAVNTH